jgi:hypothetical protein
MQITLTPQAEELLKEALGRNPSRSPEEIVEEALAAHVDAEANLSPDPVLEHFRNLPGYIVPKQWPPRFTEFKPIVVEGEPVSEQLIRERR